MKKMKFLSVLILCVVLAVIVTSCSDDSKDSENKVYTFTYAHPFPPGDSPHHLAGLLLEEFLGKASDGRIKVEIYPSGQLGNDASTFPQLEAGTLSATQVATRNFIGFYPEFQVLEIPYLFSDVNAQSFLESPFVNYVDTKVNDKLPNVRVTGLSFNGFRQWMMSEPVTEYEDLKGLRIRTIPSPLHEKFYTDLGLNPVSVPWNDVYTALSTGVISGLDQPFTDIMSNNFFDFTKHVYMDDNIFHSVTWLLSDTWYQQLPEDLQEVVLEGMERAATLFTLEYFNNEAEYARMFEEKGGTIIRVKDKDLDLRDQKAEDMYIWFFETYGDAAEEIWTEVQNSIEWADDYESEKTSDWLYDF
ncbi:MAG: TRAP transporter substrate-binding protein [Spirochaetales bacterium]|nr:TRAP transporter substrate-binding protein [Spirochaetales bacterium]